MSAKVYSATSRKQLLEFLCLEQETVNRTIYTREITNYKIGRLTGER